MSFAKPRPLDDQWVPAGLGAVHSSMNESHTSRHSSSGRRHRHSRRHGPLFPAIKFVILGVLWILFMVLALLFFRPHPLEQSDYMVGAIGVALGLFYFWVAYGVFCRRRYILTPAYVCAGFGLLNFPVGTVFAVLLISDLVSRQQEFTK
jgi:hypothetical protein